jgi:hypothetical protein
MIYLLMKIGPPVRPSPSWLVHMRETWRMVGGEFDDVELVTKELMMPKVLAQLHELSI